MHVAVVRVPADDAENCEICGRNGVEAIQTHNKTGDDPYSANSCKIAPHTGSTPIDLRNKGVTQARFDLPLHLYSEHLSISGAQRDFFTAI